MSKILQYELWQECNNHCIYCTLGRNNIKTPDEMKINAINTAISEISQLVEGEVSVLGFVGGEFFQGQLHSEDVKCAFMRLISTANSLLNKGVIKELWLNATMTIGNQDDLYETINKIDHKDRLWILTSYDKTGRFHNTDMFATWCYNMDKLSTVYPEIKKNTTAIITGDFIEDYMSDVFDKHYFETMHNTKLFLKTPVKPDDMCDMKKEQINEKFGYNFFPREIDFMKFLMKYHEKEGDTDFKNLFSNDLKAEELHKNYNDVELRNITFTRNSDYSESLDCDESIKAIEHLKCGHSNIYQCFVDSDSCAICCKQLIMTL